ncbi:MAG TPA: LLM class flavin-dependent oxidoreductase [Solirubrobacterales bacterium]|jgi:alkanesulfonate monooxygenase SsuD/methylene tetrahydromethanopterin reductase-like flavin-dependent oxidoreductase (luciferase family)
MATDAPISGAKQGVFLPPFGELVDPRTLVDLARRAERSGWDGFFLWDHINYRPPVSAVGDAWIALAAIAGATERLRLGPMVTPLSRRRVQKVARETVSLDHLSEGRLTLGVGLGVERNGELEPFGEEVDPRRRAERLDGGLDRLTAFWAGGFEPRPVQSPRIPIWVAGRWKTRRRPLARAARWDGFFPIEVPDPDALAGLTEEIAELRDGADGPFDLVVEIGSGDEVGPWEAAGATWVLTAFDSQPRLSEVEAVIDSGPRD